MGERASEAIPSPGPQRLVRVGSLSKEGSERYRNTLFYFSYFVNTLEKLTVF